MTTVAPFVNQWPELEQTLLESFGLEGLEMLGFYLNVPIEEVKKGHGLAHKVASLIEYMEQAQRLNELIDVCQHLRPETAGDGIGHGHTPSVPTIPLSERFSIKLHPKVLLGAGSCEVIIMNEGIQRTSYTVAGNDPCDILDFSGGQKRQKMISPGQAGKINLHVVPKKRPLIGQPQKRTFIIQVTTSGNNQQSITGQIIVRPVLSTWVTAILSLFSMMVRVGVH